MTAGTWAQAASLSALQLTTAALVLVGGAMVGVVSLVPALLAVLGACCAYAHLVRQPWDRPAIQRLARRTGLLDGAVAPAAVLVVALARPDWLTGAHPVALAVAASVFAASTGFGLALCGMNTAQSWGTFNGRGGP